MTDYKDEASVMRLVNGKLTDISNIDRSLRATRISVDSAIDDARNAKDKKVGWFSGKKDAIEALQNAVVTQAEATGELLSNQEIIQKNIKRLSDGMRSLYFLGITNAAFIRSIIVQLKTKSNSPLTDEARKQLLGVIQDLERQADVYDKIQRIKERTLKLEEKYTNELRALNARVNQSERTLDKEKSDAINEIKALNNKYENELRRTVNSANDSLSQSVRKANGDFKKCLDDLSCKYNSYSSSLAQKQAETRGLQDRFSRNVADSLSQINKLRDESLHKIREYADKRTSDISNIGQSCLVDLNSTRAKVEVDCKEYTKELLELSNRLSKEEDKRFLAQDEQLKRQIDSQNRELENILQELKLSSKKNLFISVMLSTLVATAVSLAIAFLL